MPYPDFAKTTACGAGMATAVARLEQRFEYIHRRRMRDIPILNPALRVRAVGFQCWSDYWLGALVTPWFINLVLLPQYSSADNPAKAGTALNVDFPSGSFTFAAAYEDVIGNFYACSLMSPVNQISAQAEAEAIASEALLVVFDADLCGARDTGADRLKKTADKGAPGAQPASEQKLNRRQFFARLAVRATPGKSGDPA